jgi:hypothetical protein
MNVSESDSQPTSNNDNVIEKKQSKPPCDLFCSILTILLVLPIFLLIHKNIDDFNWAYNLDRWLLLVFSLSISSSIAVFLKPIATGLIIFLIIYLSYGQLTSGYGFRQLFFEYESLFSYFSEQPKKTLFQYSPNAQTNATSNQIVATAKIIEEKSTLILFRKKILEQCNYSDNDLRNFALGAVRNHFLEEQKKFYEYRNIIQSLAVFKEINSQWVYVNDPEGEELYAKASVSANVLSGDCDDHAILMASCIKVIGGKARMVLTDNHLYPELYVGNIKQFEQVTTLITSYLFANEYQDQGLHYHEDSNGDIWLNLDYTKPFPGGEFLSTHIIQIIEI